MGFVKSFRSGNSTIGIWDITESEIDFSNRLSLTNEQKSYIQNIKGFRRLQWLAGRVLLQDMLGYAPDWSYDDCGKPHLRDSTYNLSISHSMKRVSVMLSTKACGVDIQHMVPRILSLKHKFCHEQELCLLSPSQELEQLHVIWGAKESLYKAYGRRQLDFINNMQVDLNDYTKDAGTLKGLVRKKDYSAAFTIHYAKENDFMLVWAEQIQVLSLI
jgi:4'-phosphopantetheinyl transferase